MPELQLEPRKIYDFKLEKCSAKFFYIKTASKVGPIYMRMIKDVSDDRDLTLRNTEDC